MRIKVKPKPPQATPTPTYAVLAGPTEMFAGDTGQATVTSLLDQNHQPISGVPTWYSSNPAVLAVAPATGALAAAATVAVETVVELWITVGGKRMIEEAIP